MFIEASRNGNEVPSIFLIHHDYHTQESHEAVNKMFYVRKTTIYSSNDPLFCAFTVGGLPSTLVLNTEHAAESIRHLYKKMDPSSQECHILMSGIFERQTKSDHSTVS